MGIGSLGPLHYPGFRRFFAGQVLSTFGDSLVPLTIAFAVLELAGSAADLGLVLLANRVPVAVLVLVGGAVGDRWDRRQVMVAADVLRCAAQAASGLLLVTDTSGIGVLIALQAAAGVGTALFTPAATGLVPSLVPESQLRQANALLSLTTHANKMISISTAGVLVATFGSGWALIVDAATFAVSAMSLALLPSLGTSPRVQRQGVLRGMWSGWRYVATTPWLAALLLYAALLQGLVLGPHMVLGPLVSEQKLGGAAAWAIIGVAQAIGSIAGGLIALRLHPRRPLVPALAASLLMVPYLLLLASAEPVWLIAAAAVGVGLQGSYFLTTQAWMLQTHVPEERLSRVSACSQLGNLVLVPLSLAATGPIAAQLGAPAMLTAAATWVLASTLGVLGVPAVRRLGARSNMEAPSRS
ncbi:MFS transporter [Halosaccharopolyspora lacisalsi]|uniref:MFS transporter n=1 Tax=Halosaccharopolyspora lacisalsi TaxID=1000566 RepID=UPI0015FC5012|nr:MFS transporter [Halosaccharopolyspora lacisalsi]